MKKNLLIYLTLFLFLFSCGKDKDTEMVEGLFIKETPPVINTLQAVDITESSARITVAVNKWGSSKNLTLGVIYGENPNPVTRQQGTVAGQNTLQEFTVSLTNLKPNTTYYVKGYAITDLKKEVQGRVLSFKTLPPLSVVTGNLSTIATTTAVIEGSITVMGGTTITEYGHCYATNMIPDINSPRTNLGTRNTLGNFTSTITGLSASATYNVRAYARGANGIVAYGENRSFTTAAHRKPVISTLAAQNIEINSASLAGTITDIGTYTVIAYGFLYSASSSVPVYGNSSPVHLGSAPQANINYSAGINNLSMNTNYYFRTFIGIINNGVQEIIYGNVVSFTTKNGVVPSVITTAFNNVSATSADIQYEITSLGTGNLVKEHGFIYSGEASSLNNFQIGGAGIINIVGGSNLTTTARMTYGLRNLRPGTKYYVRAYAINAIGTAYEPTVREFTTADNLLVTQNLVAYYNFSIGNNLGADVINGLNASFRDGATVTNNDSPDGSPFSARINQNSFLEVTSNVISNPAELSYCAWIKTRSTSFSLINVRLLTTSPFSNLYVFRNGVFDHFGTGAGANPIGSPTNYSSVFDGNWHHIAVTAVYRSFPQSHEIRIYTDGQLRQVLTPAGSAFRPPSQAQWSMFFGMIGNADNVRIYQRAISGAEVQQIVNARQ